MASTLFYTNLNEVVNYLPQRLLAALTNDEQGQGAVNTNIIETAMEAAEDEVNSYLAKRYEVPVMAKNGDVPVRIKTLTYSITKYHLFTRANLLTPEISDEYSQALRYLSGIAKGDLTMPALDDTGFDKNNENFDMPVSSVHKNLFGKFRV